jgi:hypothetical protein
MKRIFYIISFLFFTGNFIYAQVSGTLAADNLTDLFKKYPQEKIYVHTNQTSFSAGDTLWYKIYAYSFGEPTAISKVAYLQLINKDGKIVNENKLLLTSGCAYGNINFSSQLPAGVYSLRAFTSWMMNFDEDYLFHKNIYIVGSRDKTVETTDKIVHDYSVNFFPEGGDLIDSINCKIAFKATDSKGLPIDIFGKILDNGKTITSLKSTHDGMGYFYLEPFPNHTYSTEIHFPDSSIKNFSLPASKPQGYALALNEITATNIEVAITHKGNAQTNDDKMFLIASQGLGKVISYNTALNRGKNIIQIPRADFKTGIVRLTLFDANNIPQAERILFINQHDVLSLQLNKDTVSLLPKAKSALTLRITGNNFIIPTGNYSISIIDANLKDSISENILSSLLLTSELKGYIYHPNYYFQNENDTTTKNLDLVMLTNGWRRFSWKQVIESKPLTLNYFPENSLNLAGKILNYDSSEYKKHPVSLLIQNTDSGRYMGYIAPDSAGNFILKDYNVYGNSVVYFNNALGKKKNAPRPLIHFFTTSIDTTLTAPYIIFPEKKFINNQDSLAFHHQKSFSDTASKLNAVTVTTYISKTEQLAKQYVSGLFANDRFYDIDLVNNWQPNTISLIDFIKGRFPGLLISGNDGNYKFSYRGSGLSGSGAGKKQNNDPNAPDNSQNIEAGDKSLPYFYLDENLTELDLVKDIPLSDVALIRFNPPPFPLAPFNGGFLGAICIYLKKGANAASNAPSVMENYKQYVFKGFTISREFYSPDYEVNKEFKQDNRTTLYWNPNIPFDEKGVYHFSFYNSDHAKKFYIQVEGVSNDGRLLHYEKEVE